MSAPPEKRESRSARILCALAAHPEGLSAAQVMELSGEDADGRSRNRMASNYASALNSLEERGYVTRAGRRRGYTWFITQSGHDALAGGSLRAAKGSFTHGTNYGYNVARCRCDECCAWQHAYFQKWYPGSAWRTQGKFTQQSRRWRAENPEKAKAKEARSKGNEKAKNDRSRDTASRHNQWWTGTELEIASREDLTKAEVAAILGRTLRSVTEMRGRLRDGDARARMLRDGSPPPTSTSPPRRVRAPFSSVPG